MHQRKMESVLGVIIKMEKPLDLFERKNYIED
jgi:hypothetical protein